MSKTLNCVIAGTQWHSLTANAVFAHLKTSQYAIKDERAAG